MRFLRLPPWATSRRFGITAIRFSRVLFVGGSNNGSRKKGKEYSYRSGIIPTYEGKKLLRGEPVQRSGLPRFVENAIILVSARRDRRRSRSP